MCSASAYPFMTIPFFSKYISRFKRRILSTGMKSHDHTYEGDTLKVLLFCFLVLLLYLILSELTAHI